MSLTLIQYGSLALTTITILRVLYHLWLLSLVRLGGYIVNLSDFYTYRLIGKLTAFLQLQEFSLRILVLDSSTTTAWLFLLWDGAPVTSKSHTHPSHSQSSRLLTSSLSLGVPVPRSTQCMGDGVNSLGLVFSLSSYRYSYIGFIFSSRFIDS